MGYNLCIIVTITSIVNSPIQSSWVILNEFDPKTESKRLNLNQNKSLSTKGR